jgi:hypothetical protein
MKMVNRFVSSFNNWTSGDNNSGQYYEVIENGLIAVFQNLSALKRALNPESIPLSMKSPQLNEILNEFVHDFPPAGVTVDIIVDGISPQAFWALNHHYYSHLHSEIMVEETRRGIRIFFPGFAPFAHFIYAALRILCE